MANIITGGAAASVGQDGLFCTLARVKKILNITAATFDAAIGEKIAAADKHFQNETGYNLAAADHTEYFSPGRRGGNVSANLTLLRVKEHPIISVASVVEDADRAWTGDAILPADYGFTPYAIELYGSGVTTSFVGGQRTVRATYRAGFETIPADLANGVAHYAAWLYYQDDPGKMRSAIASESMGDATVTYLNEEVPKIVAAVIRHYKRPCGL